MFINPLNAELNPICHMLALLGAHHILHISSLRANQASFLPSKVFLNPWDMCNSEIRAILREILRY
jgi:hypothetical protein